MGAECHGLEAIDEMPTEWFRVVRVWWAACYVPGVGFRRRAAGLTVAFFFLSEKRVRLDHVISVMQ